MSIEEGEIEQFKVILLGDSGVGKSAIIGRFSDNEFHASHITTIGVDFRYKDVTVDGTTVRLQIWDTAGQERFRTITNKFYRNTSAIIIVYAIDDVNSFQNVRTWLADIDSHISADQGSANSEPKLVKYLVGNKADLDERRCIEVDTGMHEADTYGIKFIETSAKMPFNIDKLFALVARDALKESQSLKKTQNAFVLEDNVKPVKKRRC